MSKPTYFATNPHPKTALIGVHAPYNRIPSIESYYQEFINLAKTHGTSYDATFFVKLRDIDPAYFFTRGKLDDIATLCQEQAIENVIISEPLTGQQERNIGDILNCTVIDRTKLILDIFKHAAHSAEGKAQVAIALLEHKKSRLAGKGIHMSQQSGAIGLRGGPGETAKERERRTIEHNIKKFRRQLETIAKNRATQRKRRLNAQVPHICLIGYTNAGKSTILNQLTKSSVDAQDKLFATLDTTTRELYLDGKKLAVMSDTVGFIQQLPHNLVEAFKSTLSELSHADLLLQVIDASDINWQTHTTIVQEILDELGIKKKMLYVFNKTDKPDTVNELEVDLAGCKPHVLVSAQSKEGLAPLTDYLRSWKRTLQEKGSKEPR